MVRYGAKRGSTPAIHPWVSDLETKVIRGLRRVSRRAGNEKAGFVPDVIIAHPGWRAVPQKWPHAKLGIYCEFYYHTEGADTGFDPEFPSHDVGLGMPFASEKHQ